jgi:hypothetical protein
MPHSHRNPVLRATWLALAILVAFGLRARGASIWELTPYQVCVWIATEQQPELGEEFVEHLSRRITLRSESVVGGAWRVKVSAAPQQLTRQVRATNEIDMKLLEQVDPEWFQLDKIVLLSVRRSGSVYSIDARELDVATHQWGNLANRVALQRSVVPDAAFRAVADCFAPLGRVESVDDDQAKIALKAGALAFGESPVLLAEGALLQPIARRNDRHGRAEPGGIRLVPWTVLLVHRQDEGTVHCDIHSGVRRPLRGRSSYRTKRLALTIRSEPRPTTLELKSRVAPDQPLGGYLVVVRTNAADDAKPEPLGETDADGRIVLPPAEGLLQLVYVRSGKRILARLPLVPGRAPLVTVLLSNDEPRLAAEAFLTGIEDRLVDVAVERAFSAARIRAHIREGRIAEAAELLDDFRLLTTHDELNDAVNRKRPELSVEDSVTEAAIDKLVRTTRERIVKYIDPQLERKLTAELAKAKAAGVGKKAAGGVEKKSGS